jgi:hypothetical protein
MLYLDSEFMECMFHFLIETVLCITNFILSWCMYIQNNSYIERVVLLDFIHRLVSQKIEE